jgi:superfamily II DNA/RNA helicase
MTNFNELNLPIILLESLNGLKFTLPTPIQAQAIPFALEGKDIVGSAQTGTGKTLAFVIPMIAKLLEKENTTALVLAPTRELAQQVITAIDQICGKKISLFSALLIGGDSFYKQQKLLKMNPHIIVGTPGRVIDHLERGTLYADNIQFLVLDETDRMFDMGFSIQLETIISQLPTKRQTLMFSATMPPKIERLAQKYLINPERISVGSSIEPSKMIKQEVIKVSEAEKYDKFLAEIEKREGSIVVFVKTKMGADRLARKLFEENQSASAIHGDLRQTKRERVMNAFRRGRCRIMVATDIAARGLDVPHIQHVINYDLPQCPEDYIHRIGRTARAGADGSSLCLITPQDNYKWNEIQRFMDPNAVIDNARPAGRGGSSGGRGGRFGSRSGGSRDGGRQRSFNDRGFGRSDRDSGPRPERSGFREGSRDGASRGDRDGRPGGNGFGRGDREGRPAGNGFGRGDRDSRPDRDSSRPAGEFSRGDRDSRPAGNGFGRGDREGRPTGNGFGRSERPGRSGGDFAGRGERDGRPSSGFKSKTKRSGGFSKKD